VILDIEDFQGIEQAKPFSAVDVRPAQGSGVRTRVGASHTQVHMGQEMERLVTSICDPTDRLARLDRCSGPDPGMDMEMGHYENQAVCGLNDDR